MAPASATGPRALAHGRRAADLPELFFSAFVTLFVVIDPLGCAPIYAGLTNAASHRQASAMALRAVLIASGILLLFAFGGSQLLETLHIELDSFRIAGGIMLFMIALDMVFEKRTQRREERAEKIRARNEAAPQVEDVSVFPMAMPMIAGPGSIATVILMMGRTRNSTEVVIVLAALALVLLITFIALIAARPLMAGLGARVEGVITRLLGVLLAALAAQLVIDGLRGSFA